MALVDKNIKEAKPREKVYKLFDGGGLHIEIVPTGGKLWRYDYRFEGKQQRLALGKYPDVSIKEARKRHQAAREQLAQGINPMAAKKAHKAAGKERSANSFEVVAREWFDIWKTDKAESHFSRVIARLEKDVFPYIGARPVAEITAPEVLTVCRRVEGRGTVDTAHRAKNNISMVMRYAVATGRASYDPVPSLKGALKPDPVPKHFAAFTEPAQVAELLRAIDAYKGGAVVRAALRLAPMFFCRPGELRNMRWADVSFDDAEWRFVSTKKNKEMIVPLARQAVEILQDLQPLTGSHEYVFKGGRSGYPITNSALRYALQAMGYDTTSQITTHGLRATARTMIRERLKFDPAVIEFQLTHGTKDPLGYDRAKYLDDRRKMMQTWADYLDNLKAGKPGNVVTFPAAIAV